MEKALTWLSGLVVPSYFSKFNMFHHSGKGVSSMKGVKWNSSFVWTTIIDKWSPLTSSWIIHNCVSGLILRVLRSFHSRRTRLLFCSDQLNSILPWGGLGLLGLRAYDPLFVSLALWQHSPPSRFEFALHNSIAFCPFVVASSLGMTIQDGPGELARRLAQKNAGICWTR